MSPEYEQLVRRREDLRKKFIDFDIPMDRAPLPSELDDIAAFKLIMHSEIEDFIEERAKHALKRSMQRWKENGAVTKVLLCILMVYYPGDYCVDCSMSEKAHYDEALRRCEVKALDCITNNNGIKRGSFVALAAIAGVLPDELDEVLLADLDRFGEERGHVAHSRVDRVRTLNSPDIEYERARAIVDALKGFDEIVEAVG